VATDKLFKESIRICRWREGAVRLLLRMVLGRAGSGKTTYCMREIADTQNTNGTNALLYIVPEQFSLQSESTLLGATHGGALYRAETLSFRRLCFRVFTERGGFDKLVLEDVGRNVILRKILFDVREELLYFKSSPDKPGFISKLGGMIAELYQYEINPETLQQASGRLIGNESLRLKLHDLSTILAAYTAYLSENKLSGEDALDSLAALLPESSLVQNAEIWIDGFKSFTPQEYRVLSALLQKAKAVTVALTVDDVKAGYAELGKQDTFFETKNTVNHLCQLANELNAAIAEPITLVRPVAARVLPALAYLESVFPGFSREAYTGDASCLRLVEADNMYTEIHAAARCIQALTRERGFRYADISIVCASHEAYARPVSSVLAQYGIPVFIDTREDILSHPLVEYLRSALEIISGDWQYESVFRFLKTGLTGLPREDIDLLENYVLAYGIRYSRWKREWIYGFAANGEDEQNRRYERFERMRMNALRERILELLSPLTSVCKRSSRVEAAVFCQALYTLIRESGAMETIGVWADAALADGRNLALQMHKQVWENVTDLLDKIYNVLGSRKMNAADFAKVLEAGFSAATLGLVPPSLDQVVVGDLRRSRLPAVKALFLLGANENTLPARPAADGVLSDDDRRSLAQNGLRLAPDALSRAAEDGFSVYNALTKPSEYLCVSTYVSGLDGKAVFPSPIFVRLRALFPYADYKRVNAEAEDALDEVSAPSPTLDALARRLRGYAETGVVDDVFKDVYSFYATNPAFETHVKRLEERITADKHEEWLAWESVNRLYARGRHPLLSTSVTQLERFSQCPFSFFLRYNLRAAERRLYEMESLQLGTLFHAALEYFVQWTMENGEGLLWSELNDETIQEQAETAVEKALAEAGNEIMRSSAQYRSFSRRVQQIAVQSIRALSLHMRGSAFTVKSLETVFEKEQAIRMQLAAGEMQLQGKVDRIDVLADADGEYIKLMDYKSGQKTFNIAEVYHGLQLQLMMYIDAVVSQLQKQGGTPHPAAVLYFRLQNPIVSFADADAGSLRDRLMAEFRMSGLVLEVQRVIENMDERLCAGQEVSVKSDIVPVSLNKAKEPEDFIISKSSQTISEEAFRDLMAYVQYKAKEIGDRILQGDIRVQPCRFGKDTGCRFCGYQAVCGFDPLRMGYRELPGIKSAEVPGLVREALVKETMT